MHMGGSYGWQFDSCSHCGATLVLGAACPRCPPFGKVHCPATHSAGAACPLCRGTGFVDELPPTSS